MSPRQRVSSTTTTSEDSGSPREAEPIVLSSAIATSKHDALHQNGGTAATASNGTHHQKHYKQSSLMKRSESHDVDIHDRDMHDIFNLLALPVVMTMVFLNWDVLQLVKSFDWSDIDASMSESWNDAYIVGLIVVVDAYFIIDLIWVAVVPSCVKSPGTIIKVRVSLRSVCL